MKKPPEFAAHHRGTAPYWQTLAEHLQGVGTLARRYAGKYDMPLLGELLGLLHDLGKYSHAFQAYLKSALGILNQDEDEDWVDAASLKGKVDHSTAGAQWAWQALNAKGQPYQALAQVVALCVASHHSGLIDCIGATEPRFGHNGFADRMAKADEKSHLAEVQRNADLEILERCNELIARSDLLAEFHCRIRQIGASTDQPHPRHQQVGLLIRLTFSCLIAADRNDTAQFVQQRSVDTQMQPDWQGLIDRFEAHLAAMPVVNHIDSLRRKISGHCHEAAGRGRGIYALTVPTGGGKTLASLRFALHHAKQRRLDRIVYVIPFTSIIDQNAQVVRGILEPTATDAGRVLLEHHSNITPERQTWQEKVLSETWDAPVIYTTMVQFLETLFGGGTRGARRMHQLGHAVIVFDEVQALPIRCVHMFNNAVNFLVEHCNSTAVMCTATQPLLHQVDVTRGALRLADDPDLMCEVEDTFRRLQRVKVQDSRRPGGWSHREIAALAMQEIERAGSCLVVTNTKSSARRIYELARESVGSGETFHLSTNMCPAHRRHVLAEVKCRLLAGLRTLCISTQLIEAGVDLDFSVVVRLLAGLDSIAQAAGRCNRNSRLSFGLTYIVNPNEEDLSRLPEIAIARDVAQRVLDDFKASPERYGHDLLSPPAISDYYRFYFYERQNEMDYKVSAKEIGHDDTLLELLSLNRPATKECSRGAASGPPTFKQAFMTAAHVFKAIDTATEGVIVPYGQEGDKLIADLFSVADASDVGPLLRKAQQFSVSVTPTMIGRLLRSGAAAPLHRDTRIQILDKRYYSEHFGVSETPVRLMETLHD